MLYPILRKIYQPKISNNFLTISWKAGKKSLCSSRRRITLKQIETKTARRFIYKHKLCNY